MKSQSKDSSNQLAGISFFGKETQENTSLESRLSEDDGEEGSDEEQASGKRKWTEPVKTAGKKKKGAKKKSEGKSSSNIFWSLAIQCFQFPTVLSPYCCETDAEPEKSEGEGIQWMSSQEKANDPKKESKDKPSLKRLKQLHQEKVQRVVIAFDITFQFDWSHLNILV